MRRVALGSLLLGVGLGLSLAACSDQKGPAIHVGVAPGATAERCVSGGPDDTLSAAGVTRVRLSFRVHGAAGDQGTFLCDRTIDVGPEPPFLRLDVRGQKTVDILAEGFARADDSDPLDATVGPWRRIASGALYGLPVDAKTPPAIRLFPTEQFRCLDARLSLGRAFHSATLLPNGQVLIVGGAVASPTDASRDALDGDQLFLTGSAEVYDPQAGTFTPVTESAPLPRAFHHAVLVGATAPYQVLLVGGLTQLDSASGQPQLASNAGVEGSRLVPFKSGVALPTRAAPAELLTYDPAGHSATRTMMSGLPQASYQALSALDGGGLVVAGGLDYGAGGVTDATPETTLAAQSGGAAPRTATLPSGRVGATLSPLSADTALVWGGAVKVDDPVGLVVTGLGAGGTLAALSATAPAAQPRTWFHTATPLGSGQVLVTGGFAVQTGPQALQPPDGLGSLAVLSVNGTDVIAATPTLDGWQPPDATCTTAGRYRPAGWESAALLPERGTVLVTGGAPRTLPCNDCDSATGGLLCSIKQASLFVPPATLSRAADLQVGRFGHSSTVLGDGTVLLVGGLSQPDGSGTRTVAEAELYNARTRVPPYQTAAPADNDADDPLLPDLTALKLERAPGELATDPTRPGQPARACADF